MTSTIPRTRTIIPPDWPTVVQCHRKKCHTRIPQVWTQRCVGCEQWYCNEHLHITEQEQVYRCGQCGGSYPCARIRG